MGPGGNPAVVVAMARTGNYRHPRVTTLIHRDGYRWRSPRLLTVILMDLSVGITVVDPTELVWFFAVHIAVFLEAWHVAAHGRPRLSISLRLPIDVHGCPWVFTFTSQLICVKYRGPLRRGTHAISGAVGICHSPTGLRLPRGYRRSTFYGLEPPSTHDGASN